MPIHRIILLQALLLIGGGLMAQNAPPPAEPATQTATPSTQTAPTPALKVAPPAEPATNAAQPSETASPNQPASATPPAADSATPPAQQPEAEAAASNLPVAIGLSAYSGYIAEDAAHFSFTGAADGTIKGSYFLEPDQKPVTFEGRAIDATSFSAKTTDPDHPYLYLKEDISGDKSKIAGALYANGGGKPQAVALELQAPPRPVTDENDKSTNPAELDSAAVQARAEAFIKAVESGDADQAASLIAFPLAYTFRGRRTLIHGPAEFGRRFNAIFTAAYLARLGRIQTAAMRATPQGLELGPGEVWFNEEGKAFALNNEPIRMFQGKKFLSNAGWTRAGHAAPAAVESKGSDTNANAATPGQRPAKRRRRRRHHQSDGGTGD